MQDIVLNSVMKNVVFTWLVKQAFFIVLGETRACVIFRGSTAFFRINLENSVGREIGVQTNGLIVLQLVDQLIFLGSSTIAFQQPAKKKRWDFTNNAAA